MVISRERSAFIACIAVIAALLTLSSCGAAEGADILEKPKRGEFVVSVATTGELQAKNSVDINGPMGARKAGVFQLKISRLVPEGSMVKPGDFVAELDKSDIVAKLKEVEINLTKYQSQVTQAKLDCTLTLAQARDDLVNLKYAMEQRELEKEEAIYEAPSTKRQAEIEYDKAVRALDQAKANYSTKVQQAEAKMREAEADLFKERQKMDDYVEIMNQFTIIAPEPGMVIYAREWDGKKRVVGSTISPWQPTVATLPDLSKMESITYVNEVDIQKIKSGQQVKVSLDANPDKRLTGTVTQVANIGEQRPNSDSKVFEVKILINESDSTLRPAMTTSNEIFINTVDDATFVPLECVHTESDTVTYVFKRDGGSAIKQEVRLGIENDNYVIIESGLSESDEIFLSVPERADEIDLQRLQL